MTDARAKQKKAPRQVKPKAPRQAKQKRTPRRSPGELEKCYGCPPEHPGWKRSQLRNRRGLPRCPECLLAYDAQNQSWPACPQCGSDTSFGPIRWNGGPLKAVAVCDNCGFEDLARKHFDELTIKTIAKPIDFERTSQAGRREFS